MSNQVVTSFLRAMESSSVQPEDVFRMMNWSAPSEWNIDSVGVRSEDVLDGLIKRAIKNNYGASFKQWLSVMVFVTKTRGVLTPKTWASKLISLYDKESFALEESMALKMWYDLAPEGAWKVHGESILKQVFEKKHWGEIDFILSKGVSPDILASVKKDNEYGSRNDAVCLLAAAPSINVLNILLKYGADPLKEFVISGEQYTSLKWMEGRAPELFSDHMERRFTIKALRDATKIAQNNISPEAASIASQKNIWSLVRNAKSWIDLQSVIQDSAEKVGAMRGEKGETLLHAFALERPEFIPNLMRLKASNSSWWSEKDNAGATVNIYLLLGADKRSQSASSLEESNEKMAKYKTNLAENSPKTLEDWWSFHETVWNFQINNRNSLEELKYFYSSKSYYEARDVSPVWAFNKNGLESLYFGDDFNQSSFAEFVKSLNTKTGFERAVRSWKGLANQADISSLIRVDGLYAKKSDVGVVDVGSLMKENKMGWSLDAVDFALKLAINVLYRLEFQNLTNKDQYPKGKESIDIRRKKEMDLVKLCIERGASWSELEDVISNDGGFYATMMRKAVKANSTAEAWWSSFKLEMQRTELSVGATKVLGKKAMSRNQTTSAL